MGFFSAQLSHYRELQDVKDEIIFKKLKLFIWYM